ncbi:MAG: sigma-70 family RNA polymerase sigma factor [Fuerstiella sp.]
MNTIAPSASQTVDYRLPEQIFHIYNDAFESKCDHELMCLQSGSSIYSDSDVRAEDVTETGDYESLRGLPLLSPEGETFLFRKMNYLKYQAEQLRQRLLANSSGRETAEDLSNLLTDADAVRNQIAECNLRLVISIARKFCTSFCDFDELMSEGNEILLKAINKFDFSRGFRFSTYATHSVQRHFYRYAQRSQRRNTLEFKSSVEVLNEIPNAESDAAIGEWVKEEQRMTSLIAMMADRLNEREHQIVTARFGLTKDGVVKTLRELSAEMGLSKERVRQLQIVAVDKLRDLFDELDPEIASC